MRNIGTLSLLEAYDFEVTEPLVREDRRFLRMVRADLSGDPAERGRSIWRMWLFPKVWPLMSWGLCRLCILSGHRASRQRRMLRRSPQSDLRHPCCPCPGSAQRPHPLPCRCRRPLGRGISGGTHCAASSISGVSAALFINSFSSPGERGGPVMVSLLG